MDVSAWLFGHLLFWGSYMCVFCICTCSAQLSMFHMERHSRNTLIIIIDIIRWDWLIDFRWTCSIHLQEKLTPLWLSLRRSRRRWKQKVCTLSLFLLPSVRTINMMIEDTQQMKNEDWNLRKENTYDTLYAFHPRRRNVTTSKVGLGNGHIRKNLTKNGEPQRSSWGMQKKKKIHCC